MKKDGWRKVDLYRLAALIHDVPPALQWRWERVHLHGRAQLMVVSPRGVRWHFKLSNGAWLKKAK